MSEPLPDITIPTGTSRFNIPAGAGFVAWFATLRASINVLAVEILNRAVIAATAAGKAAAALPTGEGGSILYAVVDKDGRRTVLEINGDGDWTPRSYEMMARNPTLVALLGKSLGLDKLDPTVTDLSMAVVDLNGRRTDFELDAGGHVTERVIGLWANRLGGGGGSSSSTTFPTLDWAHWGDSLTAGGWPALLAPLTGRNHYNGGWGGQNTSQIAARQGAVPALVTVSGGVIPASGPVSVTEITNTPLSEGGSRSGTLAGVAGLLSHPTGGTVTFTRNEPGVTTPMPARSRFTPEDGLTRRDRILTIWAGRNGFKVEPPESGVQRTQAMIDYTTSQVKRVMVMEIPPWVGEENGTSSRANLDKHNTARAAAFAEYWLPIATWLRTDAAATAAGVMFTADDRADIANGLTPRSLRSDDGHLNDFGNKAIAYRVHQEALNRGWI